MAALRHAGVEEFGILATSDYRRLLWEAAEAAAAATPPPRPSFAHGSVLPRTSNDGSSVGGGGAVAPLPHRGAHSAPLGTLLPSASGGGGGAYGADFGSDLLPPPPHSHSAAGPSGAHGLSPPAPTRSAAAPASAWHASVQLFAQRVLERCQVRRRLSLFTAFAAFSRPFDGLLHFVRSRRSPLPMAACTRPVCSHRVPASLTPFQSRAIKLWCRAPSLHLACHRTSPCAGCPAVALCLSLASTTFTSCPLVTYPPTHQDFQLSSDHLARLLAAPPLDPAAAAATTAAAAAPAVAVQGPGPPPSRAGPSGRAAGSAPPPQRLTAEQVDAQVGSCLEAARGLRGKLHGSCMEAAWKLHGSGHVRESVPCAPRGRASQPSASSGHLSPVSLYSACLS
jgi:hypothetical protein